MFPTFLALGKSNSYYLIANILARSRSCEQMPGGGAGGRMRAVRNSWLGQELHRKQELISFWIFFQFLSPNCHCWCMTVKIASWISKADVLSMTMPWWVDMNGMGVISCDTLWYLWISTLYLIQSLLGLS